MITFGRSYRVGDRVVATLEEAQREALFLVLKDTPLDDGGRSVCITALLEQRDAVINILTTKDSSLPRARRILGGTKKRPAKVAQATEAA